MMEEERTFVCSSCYVCGQSENTECMCPHILNVVYPAELEKVLWCVCHDCLSKIIE